MASRVSVYWLVPALAAGGVAAYLLGGRPAPIPEPVRDPLARPEPASPPAGHAAPPTDPGAGAPSPHGAMPGLGAGDTQAPASVTWTAPPGWASTPNTSPMRLATYKVSDAAELTVVRAGGTVDQNVARWAAQFDGNPKPERAARKVHGLDVTVVRLAGAYTSGGMMGPGEKHDGWAMLAAVVEGGGPTYFFKLVGPAADVDKARSGFDALVASLAPAGDAGVAGGPGGW